MSDTVSADKDGASAPWDSPAQGQTAAMSAAPAPQESHAAATPSQGAISGAIAVEGSSSTPAQPLPVPDAATAAGKSGNTVKRASSSVPGKLLERAEVARDENIFRPDGEIVFPRSDGDPEYGPPNVVPPKPTDQEVNYYYSWRQEAVADRDWGGKIGAFLAQEFGLPPKPPQGTRWFIKRFPKHYEMTEQRKGPTYSVRTDPYLFGSKAHRFRSAVESVPHFLLLLLDPSMDPRNCACKYCKGKGTDPRTSLNSTPKAPKAAKAPRVSKVNERKGATGKRQSVVGPKPDEAYIHTRRVLKREAMPGVPVDSVAERDAELARGTPQRGKSEGFRVGELCWAALPVPASAPNNDPASRITHLVVSIERKEFDVNVAPDTEGSAAESFDLSGRVSHNPAYLVKVIGTNELARVKEEELRPLLSIKVSSSLTQWLKVDPAELAWLESGTPPKLHLFPDPNAMPGSSVTMPGFSTIVSVFAYGLRISSLVRSTFTPTDQFTRAESGLPAPPTQSVPSTSHTSEESHDAVQPSNDAANSATADGGPPAISDGPVAPSPDAPEVDTNLYFQGCLFGPERIWVGDTVRLHLDSTQVKKLLQSMGPNEKMPGISPNVNVPFVMRVKAIFAPEPFKPKPTAVESEGIKARTESAEAQGTVRQTSAGPEGEAEAKSYRIAGDLYQVMEEEEAKKLQIESHMAPTSTLGPVARSTYIMPARPFITEIASKLPPSAILPEGFTLHRVNQGSIEIECALSQIAGRLWTSLAPSGLEARNVVARRDVPVPPQEADEPDIVSLSLAGLLPGHLKMVGAELPKLDRDDVLRESEGTACALLRNYIHTEWRQVHPVDVGDDSTANDDDSILASTQKRKRGRPRKSDTGGAAGTATPSKSAGATSVSGTPATKKARTSIVSNGAGSPSTSTPIAKPKKKTAASAASALADRGESPPLPPGWVKKVSRKGQGTYYANAELKKVTWQRPEHD